MTVVVAFFCSDGVVIAADSMITPRMGNVNVGHHHGKKIYMTAGPQVHAFAGDPGQSDRFKMIAELNSANAANFQMPLQYTLDLTAKFVQQLIATGLQNALDLNTILAFAHGGEHRCCVFEGLMQPRLLDENHFYVALGSGKLSADPFLRFLVDIFCKNGHPKVSEAIFLATWTIQHVIDTNSGGVAGPIRITTFKKDDAGAFQAHELTDNERAEHEEAMESAIDALISWHDKMKAGPAAPQENAAPPIPEPPPPGVQAN